VDIAHETLISSWTLLRAWLSERRSFEQVRRRLESATRRWEELGKKGGLLDEVELLEAERYLSSPDAVELGYSSSLLTFVNTSQKAIEDRKNEQAIASQRELEQQKSLVEEQRRRAEGQTVAARQLRYRAFFLTIALVIAVLLAGTTTFVGYQSNQRLNVAQGALRIVQTQAAQQEDSLGAAFARATAQALNRPLVNLDQRTLTPMPVGTYNIAVAGFLEIAANGRMQTSELAHSLSLRLANVLADSLTSEVVNRDVVVWGPNETHVGNVMNSVGAVAAAQELNADMLIYGSIETSDANTWRFQPGLVLSDPNIDSAIFTLLVSTLLGPPIVLPTDRPMVEIYASTLVSDRITTLMLATIGTTLLEQWNKNSLQRANVYFSEAIIGLDTKSFTPAAETLLYYLSGETLLRQYLLTRNTGESETKGLLAEAEEAFLQALRIDPADQLATVGYADALRLQAMSFPNADPCAWNWKSIEEAVALYQRTLAEHQRTLAEPTNDAMGHSTAARAYIGLGGSYLWQGVCTGGQALDEATRYYEKARVEAGVPVTYRDQTALGLGTVALFRSVLPPYSVDKPDTALLALALEHYTEWSDHFQNKGMEPLLGTEYLPYFQASLCLAGEQPREYLFTPRLDSSFGSVSPTEQRMSCAQYQEQISRLVAQVLPYSQTQ
jgi:tetratricopeptide (TPR) repeat protein